MLARSPPSSLSPSWPYTHPLLELVNSNFVLEPPRPVGPVTKYTGPILAAPARPLPPDLEAWLAGAGPSGAVLVSFGGTLAAPPAASRAVLRAVAAMADVRFIWKLSEAERAALGDGLAPGRAPPNLKVAEWLPQNDILGHPRLAAFVTQGGFLSIAEAAYHGVPIVGVPLIAGQGELIRFAADQGRGVLLHKSALTRGDAARFEAALRAVLGDGRFKAAAALAAERLRAARVPYREQAADWVEFAAALRHHRGFLHTQGQRMRWWRVACLDVAAAAGALLLVCVGGPAAYAYRVWAAGRAAGPHDEEHRDDVVSVQLMFPPGAAQQAAAKHLGGDEAAGGAGGGGGDGGGGIGDEGAGCSHWRGEGGAAAAAAAQGGGCGCAGAGSGGGAGADAAAEGARWSWLPGKARQRRAPGGGAATSAGAPAAALAPQQAAARQLPSAPAPAAAPTAAAAAGAASALPPLPPGRRGASRIPRLAEQLSLPCPRPPGNCDPSQPRNAAVKKLA